MIQWDQLLVETVGYMQIDKTDYDKFNLPAVFKAAQRDILNSAPIELLTNAIRTRVYDLEEGVSEYLFPPDYLRFYKLWVDYDNAISRDPSSYNDGYEAAPTDDIKAKSILNPASKYHPKYALKAEHGFELRPIPDSDRTDGWRIRYIREMPAPNTDKNCLLNEKLRNAMIYRSVQLACLTNNYRPNTAKVFGDLFVSSLQNIRDKE